MTHTDGLIVTIAVGLGVAFIGGFIATRLRLPAIVGYLLAGVVVGPFTPGFVANGRLAHELAEIGVILLLFGVGLHFSARDLLSVKSIAIPGALGQSVVATALGVAVALFWGWSFGSGVVLGLAISVASTVVLLRALAQRDMLSSLHGRVAIGWLIVEDLFTVLVLVVLPVLAPVLGAPAESVAALDTAPHPAIVTAIALVKVVVLGAVMLIFGARGIPWLLVQVSRTGSRELFTLAVLALALGIALLSATVFGVSLALGAFLAGVVVSESDLSHQAASDALPLRDAFAVLFFVSVGMLFDPAFVLSSPIAVLTVVGIVIVGKGLTALVLVGALGYPLRTGLTVAAGLAQVGEFSFILADLGRTLGLLPGDGHSLILAAAIVSITLNPLVFRLVEPIEDWLRRLPRLAERLGSLSG